MKKKIFIKVVEKKSRSECRSRRKKKIPRNKERAKKKERF